MALVSGIGPVILVARDLDRSAAFYRDVLGIPLTGDEHWQEATLNGTTFALHAWFEGAGEVGPSGIHVNFRVDDAAAAAERLREAGVEFEESMRGEFGIALRVIDPSGYAVYLHQPPG